MTNTELVPVLTESDRRALRAYWEFFGPHRERILAEAGQLARPLDGVAPVLSRRDDRGYIELERNAILDGDWVPYVELMRARGKRYAESGVAYMAWFNFGSALRERYFRVLHEHIAEVGPGFGVVALGTHLSLDIRTRAFGSGFFDEKEEQVRHQEREFRAMFEDSPVPMWTRDPATGRVIAVNEAALETYGYERSEFLALVGDALVWEVDEIPAEHPPESFHAHRSKAGAKVLVEKTVRDLRVGDRALQLVAIVDVTDRERTREALRMSEAQLQHSQKMEALGRLAGGVAHDFNNMLTVMQSYACMLEESLDPSDARHHDATEIRLAAERAGKLTKQLLTMGRKAVVAPRPIRLDELVEGFRSTLHRLLGPGIVLQLLGGTSAKVVVDPGQVEQVVMNLAVNARDAMSGEGTLTIEIESVALDRETAALHGLPAGRYVVLAITDSGSGMDAEVQKRIFDPFFTTKEVGKGTGLGLSITHGIVTQAGGAIAVYSELGHGTTFRIRLPEASGGASVGVGEPTGRQPRELQPVTVLVVDAEPELRALAGRVLGAAGCTVLEAMSTAQAREICLQHDGGIDVLLVDVALPDGRGDRFVPVLHELRPDMRIIVMSGFPASTLGPSAAAPFEFLAKPFTPSSLRDAVAAASTAEEGRARKSEPSLQSRILVVDDDPTLRRMLTRLLKRAAYDVVDVGSGREALAELSKRRFDVVLSDIHMPDGDGIELLRSVRRIDLDIPVILISGKPDVATAATALEFGAFRYLTKPLETEAVEKVVRQAARAHALARIRRQAMAVGGGNAGAVDRAGLEVRFEKALENLWVAFQPIVDAHTGALFGVEALMRSNEPSLPTPLAILDAAGQLARLPMLGRRMRELTAMVVQDRPSVPSLFVNLHPDDLLDVHLLDPSAPLTQLAPRVILEVTERESLVAGPALTERLLRLRELGFRIAVDDIGAGYSGLTSFADLTPEIVKIDMSLVRAIHTSRVKQQTVGALCRLCHEMGTLVVGEGVETPDEQRCVVELGCDLLQGYLIARPSRDLP